MEKKNNSKLGKGLGALLGGASIPVVADSPALVKSDTGTLIRVDSIEVNPSQPRYHFDEGLIEELAISIKTYGLIQPITVRPVAHGKYQLISGERRLRASKLAGLTEIPAYVRTVDEILSLQMALVENIQRENLNAIEVALSYRRLLDECNLSHEELSQKIGKERTTITNYLRLLKLCHEGQIAVRDKKITPGHARAIVSIEDETLQEKLVKEVIAKGLSVRQTEEMAKTYTASTDKVVKTKVKVNLADEIISFQKTFSKALNSKVKISKDVSGKGKITIPFSSQEDLDRLIALLETKK